MAQVEIVNPVEISNVPLYYPISATNECGQIVIDIDEENYTDGFKQYIGGIVFHFYIENPLDSTEYIPIRNRGCVWNTNTDLSLVVKEIPKECYVSVLPILNAQVKELKNSNGTYKYPELQNISSLPVGLIFDDAKVSAEGGNYEDADDKLYPLDPEEESDG